MEERKGWGWRSGEEAVCGMAENGSQKKRKKEKKDVWRVSIRQNIINSSLIALLLVLNPHTLLT